jgi:addiction module RelE/StbE family toxin
MKVFFHKYFEKRFAKLSPKVQKKTLEHIKLFESYQFAEVLDNHALSGKYIGSRSINITGNYRAIYDLISDDSALFVDIGTHSQLYG